jgi:FixJ family two-component response regulator
MHGPLIAIIDDDETLCISIGDFLRAHEYRVELFLSADAFLARFGRVRFDCVIADVCMPGDGGFTLVHELRESGSLIPIILITGLLERHLDEVAMSFGARCLLRKPLQTATLLNQIKMSLSDERA